MISDFMKKLLVAMLVLSLGFALDISGTIVPNSATVQQGTGTSFDIVVVNHEPYTVGLQVALTGIPTWMRVYPGRVSIPYEKSETIKLYFSNNAVPDSYIYRIQLLSNGTSVWEGSVVVNVIGRGGTATPPAKFLKISAQANTEHRGLQEPGALGRGNSPTEGRE